MSKVKYKGKTYVIDDKLQAIFDGTFDQPLHRIVPDQNKRGTVSGKLQTGNEFITTEEPGLTTEKVKNEKPARKRTVKSTRERK